MHNHIFIQPGNWKPFGESWNFDDSQDNETLFRLAFSFGVIVHPLATEADVKIRNYMHDRLPGYEADIDARDFFLEPIELSSGIDFSTQALGMLKSPPLVLPVICGPELGAIWWELRKCFQAAAHYACCCCARGAMEFAVNDVACKTGKIPDPKLTPNFAQEFSLRKTMNLLTMPGEDLNRVMHDAYSFTSKVIHSATIPTETQATEVMNECRNAINLLYQRFSKRFATHST